MKDYLLVLRGGLDYAATSPEKLQQNMQNWQAWIDARVAEGAYGGGDRLMPQGKVIQENKQVVDGPFAEGKEVIGGYIMIKANSLDEAVAISSSCPIFGNGGSAEIREILKM